MRSLPPPRVTRKRIWCRIKRAAKLLFTQGRIHDPASHAYRNKSQIISKIKQSHFSSRLSRSTLSKSETILRRKVGTGLHTASLVGRAVGASVPLLRPGSRNSLNVSVQL
ncbi:hypothetical protein PSN45_001664 [Yamadazyma tenuis]|uniref:uncharacterized protein n=1 Tax=Candida tenuis TaxID=2315449 RepID=UPI0027A8A566|nr:hypothetical protein PSN45_001664 [Yamadazyma tenuis]